MIIHECDRCRKTARQAKGEKVEKPKGWFKLSYRASRYGSAHQTFELCPECKVALKIPNEDEGPAIGDQIIELIEEVAIAKMEDGI